MTTETTNTNTNTNTIVYAMIAAVQRAGEVCVYIDTRCKLNTRAQNEMRQAGVNFADLLISQPDCTATGIEIACKMAQTGAVALIVLDCPLAPAALVTKLLDCAAVKRTAIMFISA